jgi:hypothetical protein
MVEVAGHGVSPYCIVETLNTMYVLFCLLDKTEVYDFDLNIAVIIYHKMCSWPGFQFHRTGYGMTSVWSGVDKHLGLLASASFPSIFLFPKQIFTLL